jgi:hypothetical protein
VNASQQREGVVQERVLSVGGDPGQLSDHRLDLGNGRKLQQLGQRHLARDQIGVLNDGLLKNSCRPAALAGRARMALRRSAGSLDNSAA